MEYTSDFEGYCQRCQMPQAISDVLNPHAGTSDMHLPNSAVGQPPPLPSADCPVYDPSMSHASRSLGTDWNIHVQPPASAVGQRPVHCAGCSGCAPSMSRASSSRSLGPGWNIHAQPPASAVGQRPIHCAGCSGCAPSMSRASGSLDSNFNMHTTIGLATADNLYQNSIQSSSIVQYRATGVGTEDHLSPGRTLGRTWSSAPSHFAQEISPPNENSMQYTAAGFGLKDCLSPGQATTCAWPSALSPITPGASPPNGNNNEVDDVEATSARNDPQNQDGSDSHPKCKWRGCKHRKRFSTPGALMRHIKVQHVTHRSIRCPECGQAFGRVDNMKEHRGRRHRVFD